MKSSKRLAQVTWLSRTLSIVSKSRRSSPPISNANGIANRGLSLDVGSCVAANAACRRRHSLDFSLSETHKELQRRPSLESRSFAKDASPPTRVSQTHVFQPNSQASKGCLGRTGGRRVAALDRRHAPVREARVDHVEAAPRLPWDSRSWVYWGSRTSKSTFGSFLGSTCAGPKVSQAHIKCGLCAIRHTQEKRHIQRERERDPQDTFPSTRRLESLSLSLSLSLSRTRTSRRRGQRTCFPTTPPPTTTPRTLGTSLYQPRAMTLLLLSPDGFHTTTTQRAPLARDPFLLGSKKPHLSPFRHVSRTRRPKLSRATKNQHGIGSSFFFGAGAARRPRSTRPGL